MGETIRVTQNDKGYNIEIILKDQNGSIVDLTLATEATIKANDVDSNRNIVNANATISPTPTDGKVTYTVQDGDFPRDGNFNLVVTVKFGTTKTITSKPIFLEVVKSF